MVVITLQRGHTSVVVRNDGEGNPAFATQLAGRLENVEDRISDPLREARL